VTYQISDKKERTFVAFVVAGVTALSLPLIFNHISHIDGIIHLTVHAGGFVLASFLTVVALISWRKTKIARMIFSGFAFAVLALAQGVYMYLERNEHSHFNFEEEIFNIMIVVVTVLFAVGVFYKR
tara:strand:- start:256 stop:633 length:378 start_codon:yes stop_codon:yes gene_type:complete